MNDVDETNPADRYVGTGKSTLITDLATRGYKSVDTDSDEWCEWVTVTNEGQSVERDWIWREGRIQRLLATEDAEVLFVSGCKSNQGRYYPQFDHVVLLEPPRLVIIERLATRTSNLYGKHPDELVEVLLALILETVEPLLRGGTLEVDTSAPLAEIVETLLRLVAAH